MKQIFSSINSCWYLLLLSVLTTTSCISTKKYVYFADQNDQTLAKNAPIPPNEIENHDLLSISVTSLSSKASAMFNPNVSYAVSTPGQNPPAQDPSGYLVDDDGNIEFPVLGEIHVAGLKEDQLRKLIAGQLQDRKLLLDPIVSVRNLNFKVTVLGEVAHPTVVNVPTQRITLLEALGMAGDISVYGNKGNVMIIREQNGERTIKRLNLNSTELFESPYYYLKSNDIVYVELNKAKVGSSSRSSQLLPILLSGLSFIAIIASYIIK